VVGEPGSLENRLAALRIGYVAKLGEKMEEMAEAQAQRSLEALARLSHKLAGSGATFGFAEVSDAARLLENTCVNVMESEEAPSPGQVREIDGQVDELRRVVTAITQSAADRNPGR